MKADARPAKAAGDVPAQRVRTRLAIAPTRDAHEAAADRASALFAGTKPGGPRGAPGSGVPTRRQRPPTPRRPACTPRSQVPVGRSSPPPVR